MMAAPTLDFSSLCTTSRSASISPSFSPKATNLSSLLLPPPSTLSLFFSQSQRSCSFSLSHRQNPTFSTIVRFAESVLEADPPSLEEAQAESSSAGEPPLPAPKREEIFAVVMIGSRQYIVFPGRWIHTQRLKGANVNDKIILNKVLLVGTKTGTYVGKPVVTDAAVHAVVEEQLLDDKVVVFKYKKKKNYRRNIGHRHPLLALR